MKRKYLILFSLSGLVLCFDQLTKFLTIKNLAENAERVVVPGLVSLIHTRNNGFAFGLLQKAPASLQDIFFIAIPVFALVLIILIFIKLRDDQIATSVALTSILAGAIGNLIDRLQHGYVVDFLKVHWQDNFSLAAFNIADASIIVGVVIMFVNTLLQERK